MTDFTDERFVVECRDLWKIFGARSHEALEAARGQGRGKDEIRERYGCVVGVADVSFGVRAGEIFCVMGLSGSGKSTLIRHINRLIEPTAGSVLIDGVDINRLGERDLRRLRSEKIGMIFQHSGLLPHRTVLENVALGLELRGVELGVRHRAAADALARVRLKGWEAHRPDQLSGGMQQRVGLARALASDPDVLLMDEPFSALDPLIRRQLQDQFLMLSREMRKTTIFITHDLDEAIRLGDRIAIMKDGRIVQIGTAEEIVTHPADDYVADFVQGISRLKLVHARHVMRPIDGEREGAIDDLPRADVQADLSALIDLFVEHDRPVLIADGGLPVGIVTVQGLLRAIQGGDHVRS